MRRTNMRTIQLELLVPFGTIENRERNARTYDYTRRGALRTLDDFIIAPFQETLFDALSKEAQVDAKGIVQKICEKSWILGDKRLVAKVAPSKRTEYEAVLSDFAGALNGDRIRGMNYEKVNSYLDHINALASHHSNLCNQRRLELQTLDGKKLELDPSITELVVYLDPQRVKYPSELNGETFYKAKSLAARLEGIRKNFEEETQAQEGIPAKDLPEQREIDYELSDGSAVRFLFYKRGTTEYAKVFDGLAGPFDKKISSGTGDLVIAQALGFKAPYSATFGKSNIKVRTDIPKEGPATLVITRSYDGEIHERIYRIVEEEKILVSTEDVQANLTALLERYKDNSTQIKVDFYCAPPC